LKSIETQSFRDFDVVIIDDGSDDGTEQLVKCWQEKTAFPVTYHWQPNQGKHVAHNTALEIARGKFTIILDSDDMLAPNALERFWFHWNQIQETERKKYAGVEGLCELLSTGKIEGDQFPRDVFDSNYIELRKRFGIRGDKKGAVRTEVFRQYPFPQFLGEYYVRPSLLWKRISRDYLFRYINDVVQFKELQRGGLSNIRFSLRMENPNGFRYYFLEDVNIHGTQDPLLERMNSMAKYIRYSLHAKVGIRQQIKDINSPLLWLLALPKGILGWAKDRVKEAIQGRNQ
jgi:glycosyltransferase involved in cell wall biosynthesis